MTTNGVPALAVGRMRFTSETVHFRCDACDLCIELPKGEPRPKNWFQFQGRGNNRSKIVQLCPDCVQNGKLSLLDICKLPVEARFGPMVVEEGEEQLFLPPLWEDE